MIVELIGTPGSGKTTLIPPLAGWLEQRGLTAYTVVQAARPFAARTLPGALVVRLAPDGLRQPLLWQVFYGLSTLDRLGFAAHRPRLIGQVLVSQSRRPRAAELRRRRILTWFFHLTGTYTFLSHHLHPDEALIFDEGFIHRVVQFNASDVEEPRPTAVQEYVARIPRPDLLIHVRAPLGVCQQRIYRRGIWEYYREKSPEEVACFLANAERVVTLAVAQAREAGWQVIEVENSGEDPALPSAELRDRLMEVPLFVSTPRAEARVERVNAQ